MIQTEIRKQIFSGTLLVIIGVLLGFLNAGVLQPYILTPSEIGLLKAFTSFATIGGITAFFGFDGAVVRMYPQIKTSPANRKGFYLISFLYAVLGVLLIIGLTFGLQQVIFSGKAAVLLPYTEMLVIVAVAKLLFSHLDHFLIQHKNTIAGILSQDVLQRILIIASLGSLYFQIIPFNTLLYCYALALCFPTIWLFLTVVSNLLKEGFKREGGIKFPKIRDVFSTSYFGYMASVSSYFLRELDFIMIIYILGTLENGLYTVLFFFGTLVSIPNRVIVKIAAPVVGEAWKENKTAKILAIYQKSSLSMALVGGLFFLVLLSAAPILLQLMPTGQIYAPYIWVAYFIGLAHLSNMVFGVNTQIIATSTRYRVNFYFNLFLLISLAVFNYVFIYTLGIEGCALGTFLALLLNNIMRFFFVKKHFGLSPFVALHGRILAVFCFSVLVYFYGQLWVLSFYMETLIAIITVLSFLIGLKVTGVVRDRKGVLELFSL